MNINEKEFRKFLAELRKRLMAAGVKKEVIETAVAEAIIAREEKIQETKTEIEIKKEKKAKIKKIKKEKRKNKENTDEFLEQMRKREKERI